MATVLLPRSLVEMFPGAPRRLDLEADTVAGVIDVLEARWPGMSDRLCEPGPRIRPFINIFVNGQLGRSWTTVVAAARWCISSPPSRVAALRCADGRRPSMSFVKLRGPRS